MEKNTYYWVCFFFLNHFCFESINRTGVAKATIPSHSFLFMLSQSKCFFLHCMINILRHGKKFPIEMMNYFITWSINRRGECQVINPFPFSRAFLKETTWSPCFSVHYIVIRLRYFSRNYFLNNFSLLDKLSGSGWWYIATSYHWPGSIFSDETCSSTSLSFSLISSISLSF